MGNDRNRCPDSCFAHQEEYFYVAFSVLFLNCGVGGSGNKWETRYVVISRNYIIYYKPVKVAVHSYIMPSDAS